MVLYWTKLANITQSSKLQTQEVFCQYQSLEFLLFLHDWFSYRRRPEVRSFGIEIEAGSRNTLRQDIGGFPGFETGHTLLCQSNGDLSSSAEFSVGILSKKWNPLLTKQNQTRYITNVMYIRTRTDTSVYTAH